jgi:hypothetical protein
MPSQVQDYSLRGIEFSSLNFFDFIVGTYEKYKEKRDNVDEIHEDGNIENRGRKRNIHGCYLASHPKHNTHIRIQRSEHHNNLPNLVGPWFPKRDDIHNDNDFYYASLLALLKPWRDLKSLKSVGQTWEQEFERFLQQMSHSEKNVIAGLQYYYQSKNVAESHDKTREMEGEQLENEENEDDISVDPHDLRPSVIHVNFPFLKNADLRF